MEEREGNSGLSVPDRAKGGIASCACGGLGLDRLVSSPFIAQKED